MVCTNNHFLISYFLHDICNLTYNVPGYDVVSKIEIAVITMTTYVTDWYNNGDNYNLIKACKRLLTTETVYARCKKVRLIYK